MPRSRFSVASSAQRLELVREAMCLVCLAAVGRCGVLPGLMLYGGLFADVGRFAVVRRSEPSRVATQVLSKAIVEILSSSTIEVQAKLLSKLTPMLGDPTAEAHLSQQRRKGWSDMQRSLALYRNAPVDGH